MGIMERIKGIKNSLEVAKNRPEEAPDMSPLFDSDSFLSHAAWMCDDILNRIENGESPANFLRQLGFIEAILWGFAAWTLKEACVEIDTNEESGLTVSDGSRDLINWPNK